MSNLDSIVQKVINPDDVKELSFSPVSTSQVLLENTISNEGAIEDTKKLSTIVLTFIKAYIDKLADLKNNYLISVKETPVEYKLFEKTTKRFDTLDKEYNAIYNALILDIANIQTLELELDSLLRQHKNIENDIQTMQIGSSDTITIATQNANKLKQIGTLHSNGRKITKQFRKSKIDLDKLINIFQVINSTLPNHTITYNGNRDIPRTTINFKQDLENLSRILQFDDTTKIGQSLLEANLMSMLKLEKLEDIDRKFKTTFVPFKINIPENTITSIVAPEDILMRDVSAPNIQDSIITSLSKLSADFNSQLQILQETVRQMYYSEIYENPSDTVFRDNYNKNMNSIEIELSNLKSEMKEKIDRELIIPYNQLLNLPSTSRINLGSLLSQIEALRKIVENANAQTLFKDVQYTQAKTFLIDDNYPYIRGKSVDFNGNVLVVEYEDTNEQGKRSKRTVEITLSEFDDYQKSKSFFIKRDNLRGKDKKLILKLVNLEWNNSASLLIK